MPKRAVPDLRWPWVALVAVALLGPVAAVAYGQSGPTHFAAVSIRPGESPGAMHKIRYGMHLDPERLMVENMSLKDLIVAAYNLRPYQIAAPDWMAVEPFTISGTTTVPLSGNAMRALLQPFLVQQFGIKLHWATKTMPVYALQQAPGGVKLPAAAVPPAGAYLGQFMMRLSPAGLTLSGMASMDQLANVLSSQINRPVVNKTGLSGVYKFDLTFATPDGRVTMGGLPHVPQMNGQPMPMNAPSVFTALPEQAGLKLEKTRAAIKVLVIDAANKEPRGN